MSEAKLAHLACTFVLPAVAAVALYPQSQPLPPCQAHLPRRYARWRARTMNCRDAEAPLRGRTPLETVLQMLLRHISYRLRAATRCAAGGANPRSFRGASLPVGPYCNRTANSSRKREIPATARPLFNGFAYRTISRKYNAPIVKKRWSGTLFDAQRAKTAWRGMPGRYWRPAAPRKSPDANARQRAGRIGKTA